MPTPILKMVRNTLIESALTLEGVHSEAEILAWIEERSAAHNYSVEQVPLDALDNWSIDSNSGDLFHVSGKFFRVTGLDIKVSSPVCNYEWSQPIVIQPEVGILGFIAQHINGVLHLLVQAKMEPGNINLVQISPTVQATRSNYSQVHGGRRPPFIDYFLELKRGITLVDQLQSEQGTRYLRKRNRNVIIQIDDNEEILISQDFFWITLGQLHRLHRFPNLVHLDCRSILGSLTLHPDISTLDDGVVSCNRDILESLACPNWASEHTLSAVLGWLGQTKIETELNRSLIPLCKVVDWHTHEGVIQHKLKRFFQVIGVNVCASSREVTTWSQPLIKSADDNSLLGLLLQKRGGIIHCLVQARVEPGLIDAIELAPTVQCSLANYAPPMPLDSPPFVEIFHQLEPSQLRVDTLLSEEGGRFYHSQQRHVVAELDIDASLSLPSNFCWMTLAQLHTCAQFSCMLNIELRSLLSCIPLI